MCVDHASSPLDLLVFLRVRERETAESIIGDGFGKPRCVICPSSYGQGRLTNPREKCRSG
jgi:hypothetical protein